MSQLFKNNARTTLGGSGLSATAGVGDQFSVATGKGALFPAPGASDYFDVFLQDATNIEIIRVNARASDVFTILERAREGTTAVTFASGSIVALRVSAAALETLVNHAIDTADAHAASAITNTPAGSIAAVTVQAAINEIDADVTALAAHIVDTSDAHDASAISYLGSTNLVATNVEAALDELDAEKQPVDARLTALAGLLFDLDYLIYTTGPASFGLIQFDAAARTLLINKKFSGTATFDARYDEKVNARGSISGAQTINGTLGTYVTATITGTTTFTFSNPATSGYLSGFMLELTNGGVAAITWPASVKWPAGAAPTLTASGVDVLLFTTRDGGTTWRGSLTQKDSK